MKELERNNLCSRGGDMVGYLYGEISASDTEAFELHLAECGSCIDDFAELSQSWYPVYEWKHLDFDPLDTPQIAINYAPAKVSIWEWIRIQFDLSKAFGPVGAVVAILIVISAGYLLLIGSEVTSEVVQQVGSTPSPETVAAAPGTGSLAPDLFAERQVIGEVITNEAKTRKSQVLKALAEPPRKAPKPRRSQQAVRQTDQLPVLTTTDDYEDDSLRLADLFEDIETSE